MNLKKHRLPIAAALLVVLGVGTVLAVRARDARLSGADEVRPSAPSIDAASIQKITITRPDATTIELSRDGERFRLTAPLSAPTDGSNVDAIIEKLTKLDVVGVAASNPENHALLEVDDANAVRVVVERTGADPVTLRIGAFRGGNTMVRVGDAADVLAVSGSIKFAFTRTVDELRDRGIVNVATTDVTRVSLVNAHGTFEFARSGADEDGAGSEFALVPGGTPVPNVDPNRVESLAATFAHLRAESFAPEHMAVDFGTPRAKVALTVRRDDGTDETITLELGPADELERGYVRRGGSDVVFLVSAALVERLMSGVDAFQPDPDAPAPVAESPGSGGIPPELLEQLQRQMQAGQPMPAIPTGYDDHHDHDHHGHDH